MTRKEDGISDKEVVTCDLGNGNRTLPFFLSVLVYSDGLSLEEIVS